MNGSKNGFGEDRRFENACGRAPELFKPARRASFIQNISPSHLLLLKAALLEENAAISAYNQWRPNLDLATISYGEQRLLPLLQRNLTRLGVEDRLIELFRGIRRNFWVRNLKSIALARQVFEALGEKKVPFMVLKGAALVACGLEDRSLRPMEDIDILVREDRLADTVAILTILGLQPQGLSCRQFMNNDDLRSNYSGWPFIGGKHQNVDLHWKALQLDLRPEADHEFWHGNREASLDGVPIRVLNPSDQLLHICAHAAEPTAGAAAQGWPADAAMVIRGSPDLCFKRLALESARHELSAIIAESLSFLADEFNLPIPKSAIADLRSRARWIEHVETSLQARGVRRSRMARLILAIQDFRRRHGFDQSIVNVVTGFVTQWAGVKRLTPALLIAAQAILNWPSWLRTLLGRDAYRVLPEIDRLPQIGSTLDLVGTDIDETPLIAGWSFPEPTGRWTLGHEATIAWCVRGHRGNLSLKLDGYALIHDRAPVQTVELWANDKRISVWRFDSHSHPMPARVPISIDIMRKREVLVLTFLIRRPISPFELGIASDSRALGFHLRWLKLVGKANKPR